MEPPAVPTTHPKNLIEPLEVDAERFHRIAIVQAPGLQLLHLTLAPGQAVPRHNHPDQHVVLQGLAGALVARFDSGDAVLRPGDVLEFPGEVHVAPRNDGTEPAAMLITLARRPR